MKMMALTASSAKTDPGGEEEQQQHIAQLSARMF